MSTTSPAADLTNRVRAQIPMTLLGVFAVLAASVALFWQTVASLTGQWTLGNYRHGWLVAILSCALLIRDRRALAVAPIRRDLGAAALLLAVSILWAIVFKANIQVGHQLLWPLLALLAVAAFFGRSIAAICAFPIGFIYLVVPIWNVLIPLLQKVATVVVEQLLRLSSISVFISGDIVQVAAGDFEIADGCSGLNYLLVAITVAAFYGEILRCDWRARLRLVAIAAGLALIGNWLRIYSIILVGVLSDMKSGLVQSHVSFGWGVFAGVMVVFFLIVNRMRTPEAKPRAWIDDKVRLRRTGFGLTAAMLGAIGLASGPALIALAPRAEASASNAGSLLASLPGWIGPTPPASNWRPDYRSADAQQAGIFTAGGGTVDVFLARYLSQRQGRELVSTDNSILGNPQQVIVLERNGIEQPRALNELVVEDARRQKWVLWYGYSLGNRWFVSGYAEALWYGLSSLGGAPVASVVATRARCESDCEGARALLERFWREANFNP